MYKHGNAITITALLLAAALSLGGCAQSPAPAGASASSLAAPEAAPAESSAAPVPEDTAVSDEGGASTERYSVFSGGDSYYFDGGGNIISGDDEFFSLNDTETGEELYRVYTRYEDTGGDDEWGNPIVEHFSALFDTEGNMLFDYEPVTYQQGAGRLIIRRPYIDMFAGMFSPDEEVDTSLWDPASGEKVIDGVMTANKLSDGVYLALDQSGKLLGVIDDKGNKLAGFPAPVTCYHPSMEGGYILGDSHDPYSPSATKERSFSLMDKELNILFEGKDINIGYVALVGPYMLHTNGEGLREILSLETFEPLFSYDADKAYLQYFDGERMILRTGERDSWKYTLCHPDGVPLSGVYDDMSYDHSLVYDELPSERFVARDGDTVSILDRDGEAMLKKTIPDMDSISMDDCGYFSYSINADDGVMYGPYTVGLLDPELNMVIPAGRYTSIYRAASYSKGETEYFDGWICHKEVGNSYRIDLLDLKGEPIIENITSIGTISSDRISLVRGFSKGLVDWQGNWIARYSVYDSLSAGD